MGEWIEWGGGECPATDGTVVQFENRGGGRWYTDKASDYYWGSNIIVVGDETDTPVKTLRDEFAMAALGGLLGRSCDHLNLDDKALFLRLAEGAYALADAMLAAREEGK